MSASPPLGGVSMRIAEHYSPTTNICVGKLGAMAITDTALRHVQAGRASRRGCQFPSLALLQNALPYELEVSTSTRMPAHAFAYPRLELVKILL
jgi:hypothetical protein